MPKIEPQKMAAAAIADMTPEQFNKDVETVISYLRRDLTCLYDEYARALIRIVLYSLDKRDEGDIQYGQK